MNVTYPNASTAGARASALMLDVFRYVGAVHDQESPVLNARETGSVVVAPSSQTTAAPATPLEPCGGDLPSCAIVARESGGSYTAVNPTGCGGSGCFGKYQFSGAWAGKLGLPADPATWTPEQQDNAARALWNHGAGCSNWSC